MSSSPNQLSPSESNIKVEKSEDKASPPKKTKMSEKNPNYISWDDYFMALAVLSSKRSKDPATQVGACIVNDKNLIVSIGYNGMPYGCSDDEFPWVRANKMYKNSDSDCDAALNDKNLYVVHAEANAILNKNGLSIEGARIYTTLFPCNECAKLIIQSGLKTIIYLSDEKKAKKKYRASKTMLDAAGIKYKLYIPERKEISINLK